MALSKKQAEGARKMAAEARRGSSVAIAFFETLEKRGGQMWDDYKAVRDGNAPDSSGQKRAYLDTKVNLLSSKQVASAVSLALSMKTSEIAKRFYADQSNLSINGSAVAAQFVAVIDEVVAKQAAGVDIYKSNKEQAGPKAEIAGTVPGHPAQTALEKASRLRAIADQAVRDAESAELDAAQAAPPPAADSSAHIEG